jgi:hypothetical protein
MKINYWKVAAISLVGILLIGIGYESNYWIKPTPVKAQDMATPAAPGRFQLIKMKTNEDMLLDTATGKVFDFYNGGSYLQQIPVKSCADAECANRKPTIDAR